jgi:PRTRC genetic system protein B
MEFLHGQTKAEAVLVFYNILKTEKTDEYENHYHDSGAGTSYIEMHPVKKGKILAGRPLTLTFMRNILKSFSEHDTGLSNFSGIIPKNVLYHKQSNDDFMLMWYHKPKVWSLNFTSNFVSSGDYYLPGMLICIIGTSLYVYSYKDKTIDINTKLFRAPLFNINDKGLVCTGNIKLPRISDTPDTIISEYDSILNSGVFTSGDDYILKNNINLSQYFKDLTKKKTKQFDRKLLIPSKNSIKNLISL